MIFTRKIDKEPKEEKSNITFYQDQLSHVSLQKLVVLQGHHYLHWTKYREMSKDVNDFIDTSINSSTKK
ncbi:hypothetical protein V7170_23640 [Priestia megaterium]